MTDEERQRIEGEINAKLDARDFEGAATIALRTFGPDILGFLYRATKDDDAGDDVFGMFCEDLWTAIEKFERRSSFKTWAYRLAWHAACRYWKDPWSKRKKMMATGGFENVIAEVRSQTMLFQRSDAKRWLASVKEDLKEEDLAVLTLRLEKNLPLEEVAEIVGASHEATRQRWSRLKKRLAKMAGESGLGGG